MPDPQLLAEAARVVHAASRPVVILGPGAWFAHAEEEILRLVDRIELPAFSIDEARGMVPDDHPLGFGGLEFRLSGAVQLIARADVILAVGVDDDWRSEHLSPPLLSCDAMLITIDSSQTRFGRTANPTISIRADERRALNELLSLTVNNANWPDWQGELRLARSHTAPVRVDLSGIHPAQLVDSVDRARANHDANVTIDGGHIGKWAKAGLHASRPGQVNRLKGAFAAIGHGLPSAMCGG